MSTARSFPYSISPLDGYRLRVAFLKEDPALGSDVSLGKVTADARAIAPLRRDDTLALRLGGGTTFGRPSSSARMRSADSRTGRCSTSWARTTPCCAAIPTTRFAGRSFVGANLEYRFPLAHPQRGCRLCPSSCATCTARSSWTWGTPGRAIPVGDATQDGGRRSALGGRVARPRPAA